MKVANDWFSVHQKPAFLHLPHIVPSKWKPLRSSVCTPVTHFVSLQLSGPN